MPWSIRAGAGQGGTRIESEGCARGPMVELEGAAMGARHPLPPMRRIERAAARGDPPYIPKCIYLGPVAWTGTISCGTGAPGRRRSSDRYRPVPGPVRAGGADR